MSFSTQLRAELLDLLADVCEDVATETQRDRLRTLTAENREARQFYIRHMHLAASLRWSLDDFSGPRSADLEQYKAQVLPPHLNTNTGKGSDGGRLASRSDSTVRRLSRFVGLAASVMLIGYFAALAGLLGWDRYVRSTQEVPRASSESYGNAAVLVEAEDCRWEQKSDAPARGDALGRKSLRLASGMATIRFDGGATVIVEGPAEFETRSTNRGFLKRGKLVATVPRRALGFTIETPVARIVDLGTKFGVEVDEYGAADLEVYEGQVVIRSKEPSDAPSSSLEVFVPAGMARRVERGSGGAFNVLEVAMVPRRFMQRTLPVNPSSNGLRGEGDADLAEGAPVTAQNALVAKSEMFGQPTDEGLVLWLRADAIDREDPAQVRKAGDGEYVMRWLDQARRLSKQAELIQVDPERQPVLVSDAVNRMPAVRFYRARTDCLLHAKLNLVPSGSPRTVFVVGRANQRDDHAVGGVLLTFAGPHGSAFVVQQFFSGAHFIPNTHFVYSNGNNPRSNAIIADASSILVRPFVSVLRSEGAGSSVEAQLNGEDLKVSGGRVYAEAAKPRLTLGALGGGERDAVQGWDGDIAEVLLYDRALPTETIQVINRYLARKYRPEAAKTSD